MMMERQLDAKITTEPQIDVFAAAAVRALHAVYWACADGRDPTPPATLFEDDAVFSLGSLRLRGRDELTAFFAKRQADIDTSSRVTRHLASDVTLRPLGEGRMATENTVLAFSGYGALPIASSLPSVADFVDVCRRQRDGRWLFERRTATSIFTGPEAPAFAHAAPASDQGDA
ncbi:MAG: hypothetical protein EOP89_03790 [Lysobacteraceae bacterium]|nr:MAG: hypothetical protein EOP89_03790 [Xanthomonadaceae bacterium]